MKSGAASNSARRQAIQRLISSSAIPTQEALRRQLAKEGFAATQTTLSRDLALLGARRVSRPGGKSTYALDGLPATPQAAQELRELVLDIRHNGALVVVLTRPGAASAIARTVDESQLPEVLATLAGDDTIFVAPAARVSSRRLMDALTAIFGREL